MSEPRHPLISRLHRLLANELGEDEWAGDAEIMDALASQWRLEQHVAGGDEGHRRQHIRNLEDAAKSEHRVQEDYAGRYPIELLQNAQDACADAGVRGSAWFRVTSTALLVGNEGVPFNAERIQSFIRLGGTTKRPGDSKHHTIGYKGIGFTSALEITAQPQIISHGVAFGLDRTLAIQELSQILDLPISFAPARYFPFPITPTDWKADAREVDALFSAGSVTVIRLPLRPGQDPDDVRANLCELLTATTLLLMPALDELSIDGHSWKRRRGRKIAGGQLHHLRSNEEGLASWLVAEGRVPISPEVVEALDDELWSGVDFLNVLVGVPWANGRPNPSRRPLPRIHAYFPTDERLGRAILTHGDFFLESSRRRIQAIKAGGEISETVSRGIVDLIGNVATAFCSAMPERMPDFIACLAERETPQGYGERIGALLDADLTTRPILRTALDDAVTPKEAKLLGVDIPAQRAEDLAAMLRAVSKFVDPAFERAAGEWLQKLGGTKLSANDVAHKLSARLAPNYDRAILAVASWWKAEARWRDGAALRSLRILRSTAGSWHTAGELCEPVPGVPALPPGLEKVTYQPPVHRDAVEFVSEVLHVEQLSLDHALDLVIKALGDGAYGRDEAECKAAHDFTRQAFRNHPDTVRDHPHIGRVPVPARSWRRGSRWTWSPATEVYFSRDWTGKADLEQLYRRFRRQEFLAAEPPGSTKRLREAERFYRCLGIADEPRHITLEGRIQEAPAKWRQLPEIQEAKRCPDDHPYTSKMFRCAILDRLPELLEGLDVQKARALVKVLSRTRDPFGQAAKMWCAHSGHRTPYYRSAIGVQRWLLEQNPWVPVIGDPLGRQLVPPCEAWVDVNGKALKACLAQAVVTGASAKFELPSATRPEPAAAAMALVRLKHAQPELANAPVEVIEGSRLLLQRLQVALHHAGRSTYDGPRPPFPAIKGGRPVWSESPAVPDFELPQEIPVSVLSEGTWSDLQQAFDLLSASDLITITTEPDDPNPAELEGLRAQDRIQLAAVLAARGGDLKTLALRLGRLTLKRCTAIRTEFSTDGYLATRERLVHLHAEEDNRATIYFVEPFLNEGRRELAALLAAHLQTSSESDTLLHYLFFGEQLLQLHGISSAAIDEAAEAVRRYLTIGDGELSNVELGYSVDPVEAMIDPGTGTPSEMLDHFDPRAEMRRTRSDSKARRSRFEETTVRKEPSGGEDVPKNQVSAFDRVEFRKSSDEQPDKPRGKGPSGARGGTGRSGMAGISGETRRDVEAAAIDLARQYARDRLNCTAVRDVQEFNKGWDLEFIFGAKEWWPVEVKGFARSAGAFVLTRNELVAARDRRDYHLVLVTGVHAESGRILLLRDPGAWISDSNLEAMSWEVRDWRKHIDEREDWSQMKYNAPAE